MSQRALAGWTAALVCLLARPAQADDDTGDLQTMLSETFVTGASKATESGATAPAVTTTLTSDDIRRYGIHTLDEAIAFLSLGAFVSKGPRGVDVGSSGVVIPADRGDHFLLLVDGHSMNEALFGAAQFGRAAGIPMEMIDHIEVILGPGSVLYGSSAMLGVVNVVTKSAHNFSGTHVVAESELLTSWRAAAGGGYEFSLFGKDSSLAFEAEYYQADGPTFTVGPQAYGINPYTNAPYDFGGPRPTGVWGGRADRSNYARIPSGVLTLHVGDFELDLRGSVSKLATPFNDDFVTPEADFNDPASYELDRSASIDLKHRLGLSAVTEIRSRLYADTFDQRRYANTSALGPENCPVDVPTCRRAAFGASRWVGAEVQGNFDWFKDATFATLLGVDGRVRSILSQRDVLDTADRPLTSTESVLRTSDGVFAAYAQQTWSPATWLHFNGGARYDYDQRFGSHVSPRVAASVQPWRGGTLKAIYSEAFRAPSWEESAVGGDAQLPAEGLRPETVRSIEVAVDQQAGPHRLVFGLFRTWWSDMVELHSLSRDEVTRAQSERLVSVAVSAATQYRNVASIDNFGFHAGYEGSFAETRLRYALNVTGALARRPDALGVDEPLLLAPQIYGNARIAYALPGELPTLALVGQLLGARPVDKAYDAGFVPTPIAPPFAELRATVSGVVPAIRGLSYRASADYAFSDRSAYVIGPFQNGPSAAVYGTPRPYPLAPELNPVDRFRTTVSLQWDF